LAIEGTYADSLTGALVLPADPRATPIVFNRMRVRISPIPGTVLPSGTYTVDHPFGSETFPCATNGNNQSCSFTIDLPGANIFDFDGALGIGVPNTMISFLRQTGVLPLPGFIGDSASIVPITGGPVRNNFAVSGPAGAGTTTSFTVTGQMTGLEIAPTGAQDFLVVRVGAAPAPTTTKTFTVTNLTGAVTGIPVITPPAGYTVTPGTCNVAITAPGTCTFDISFTPIADGAVSGNVTFAADGAPPVIIPVAGIGDGIAPTLTVAPNFFTNALQATISGTATDNILVHDIVVSLGGVIEGTSTVTNGNWSFVVAGLALNQPNVFSVAAVDAALPAPGNTTTLPITVTHDNILPAVSVTTPVATSLINTRTPTINYTVSDTNLDLEALVVKVDGTTVPVLTGQPLPSLLDGPHTVTVDGSDLAGNHTIINNIFTVDATPPVITVASPKVFNGRVGNTSPALTFTVADANLLPLNTVVRLDGVVVPTGTATLGPFLVASSHTLTIDALDGAGNPSSFTTLPFTIILSDGRIVAVAPADPGVADALLALKHAVGLLPLLVGDQFAHGDVAPLDANGVPQPNGVIDIADALTILKRAVGLPPIF
jgi:hypothetical protein